jgi:hypothetical protein
LYFVDAPGPVADTAGDEARADHNRAAAAAFGIAVTSLSVTYAASAPHRQATASIDAAVVVPGAYARARLAVQAVIGADLPTHVSGLSVPQAQMVFRAVEHIAAAYPAEEQMAALNSLGIGRVAAANQVLDTADGGRGADWRLALLDSVTFAVAMSVGVDDAAGTSQMGRGSTRRSEPRNLSEQLAREQVLADPGAGVQIDVTMRDPRWPADEGWVKMRQNAGEHQLHYVLNRRTGAIDDVKFHYGPPDMFRSITDP